MNWEVVCVLRPSAGQIRVRTGILVSVILGVSGACTTYTPLPAPRPLIVRSGARLQADVERLKAIDAWVRDQQDNIIRDPSFWVIQNSVDVETYPWDGLTIHGDTAEVKSVSDRQSAVSPDGDQGVEAQGADHLHTAFRVVSGTRRRIRRIGERVAVIPRAKDGSADPEDAPDVDCGQHSRPIGFDEAIEAILDTDAFTAPVDGGLDDGPDDRVETWRVATAGEKTDPPKL